MAVDVSVCVATCRRPAGLERLLESLARQKLPEGVRIEVLVVDNDPAGGAAGDAALAARWPDVRFLHEPRRNIALARNRALEHARGDWIAFVDDDETVCEGWIAAYLALAGRGTADGLFGPVLPRLERVVTPWLAPEVFFARPRHASGTPMPRAELRTSNAFVRRALFGQARFDPAYGRSGGSDTELFGRLADAGARFVFCDEAVVEELVPAARHRLGWLARRAFRGGVVTTRIELAQRGGAARLRGVPRALAAAALLAALLPCAALAGRAAAARVALRLCIQAGHLWAFAGLTFEEYASVT